MSFNIRTFITKEQYDQVLDFFKTNSRMFRSDDQTAYHFDADFELGIQKNNYNSKVWMKNHKTLQDTEIHFDKDDFERMHSMFEAMGYDIKHKWDRKRHVFNWKGFEIRVDDAKMLGFILEIQKAYDTDEKTDSLAEDQIKALLDGLDIKNMAREEFMQLQDDYLKSSNDLID